MEPCFPLPALRVGPSTIQKQHVRKKKGGRGEKLHKNLPHSSRRAEATCTCLFDVQIKAAAHSCSLLRIQVGCRLCVSSAHLELYSLTKHLFCTHVREHRRASRSSTPPPNAERSAASLMLAPIDHRYYCSLLIPTEMRPAAAVLGDWGRGQGQGPPPPAALQNKIQLTAAYCSACRASSEGHAGTLRTNVPITHTHTQ